MTTTIGITLNSISYTPEAYAYEKYLKNLGYQVQLDLDKKLDPSNDVNIYFMGTRPFWRKNNNLREIHEYHSLSTPPFARLKDKIKKNANIKPDGRIFLNKYVDKNLGFNDKIPSIYRDMGVDKEFFTKRSMTGKFEYDLVYCGSYRDGFDRQLLQLSDMGISVVLIGSFPEKVIDLFRNKKNIKFVGRLSRYEIPHVYSCARAGLSYTPNTYPFTFQTTTKVLEYLASGLGIVTNYNLWTKEFIESRRGNCIFLESKSLSKEYLDSFNFITPDVSDLEWSNILQRSNFSDFILGES